MLLPSLKAPVKSNSSQELTYINYQSLLFFFQYSRIRIQKASESLLRRTSDFMDQDDMLVVHDFHERWHQTKDAQRQCIKLFVFHIVRGPRLLGTASLYWRIRHEYQWNQILQAIFFEPLSRKPCYYYYVLFCSPRNRYTIRNIHSSPNPKKKKPVIDENNTE